MKNKNKEYHWINQDKRIPTLVLVLFFLIASAVSWLLFGNYLSSAWSTGSYFFHNGSAAAVVKSTAQPASEDSFILKIYCRIDGLASASEAANLVPYAVMIENLPSVRPQSGLSQASVVYETLVEGGATRFMALFDPREAIPEIMPVRSSRAYYLEWVSEYGALYAHAGGSPKALTVIRENPDINNLEALSWGYKYFWRDTSRAAPHNLVTSSEKMNLALQEENLADTASSYRSWIFKDFAGLQQRGSDGKTVSFNFSYGNSYQVDFKYEQSSNTYLRSNAGLPHLDRNNNQQISAENVVIQLVEKPVLNGEKGRIDIYVGGEGKAWIFRDGQVIEGIWKKTSRTERTIFYDSSGAEIEFNRGRTWIHVVPKDQEVKYQ